jgi:hypothetical protein
MHDHNNTSLSATDMGMSPDEHASHLGLSQSKKDKLAEVSAMKTQILIVLPLAFFAACVMGWDIL